jgi:hypothetical protein
MFNFECEDIYSFLFEFLPIFFSTSVSLQENFPNPNYHLLLGKEGMVKWKIGQSGKEW